MTGNSPTPPGGDGNGGPRVRAVPEGDTMERLLCPDCGFVAYENPKVVVGAVVEWRGRILMCRRSIAPRKGYWTIPAGYLELNETAEDGARREAQEEAEADIAIRDLLAVYAITRISQIQLIYRAALIDGRHAPGSESLETALFDWPEIPWDDLAFPSVRWALTQYRAVRDRDVIAPFANPEGETGNYRAGGVSR